MIECYGICSEKCTAMQNGKCVLDAKKAEGANDFQLFKESKTFKQLEKEHTLTEHEKLLLLYLKDRFDKYADDEYKAGYLACISEVEYFLKWSMRKEETN